jgi:hypothetical protein
MIYMDTNELPKARTFHSIIVRRADVWTGKTSDRKVEATPEALTSHILLDPEREWAPDNTVVLFYSIVHKGKARRIAVRDMERLPIYDYTHCRECGDTDLDPHRGLRACGHERALRFTRKIGEAHNVIHDTQHTSRDIGTAVLIGGWSAEGGFVGTVPEGKVDLFTFC